MHLKYIVQQQLTVKRLTKYWHQCFINLKLLQMFNNHILFSTYLLPGISFKKRLLHTAQVSECFFLTRQEIQ